MPSEEAEFQRLLAAKKVNIERIRCALLPDKANATTTAASTALVL